MSRFRLKEDHPFMQKFNQLWDKAEELGIQLRPAGTGLEAVDTLTNTVYEVRDVEDNGHAGCFHVAFPPEFDFKLVYEKQEA